MLRLSLTTFFLFILCGCASTPPPDANRLAPARHAVARAYAAGAPDLAPENYRRAREKLAEGARLNREGEPEKADLVLKQALFFASRALQKSNEAWKADAHQSRIPTEAKPQPEVAPGGDAFEVKILGAESDSVEPKKTAPQETEIRRPAKVPEPASSESAPEAETAPLLPEDYVVKEGETLWTIAARRVIYHDALLWPLIYKANRDQIKDPRQIFPQQVLTIPRQSTDEEIAEAREKARRSEIFPVEVLMRQIVDDDK